MLMMVAMPMVMVMVMVMVMPMVMAMLVVVIMFVTMMVMVMTVGVRQLFLLTGALRRKTLNRNFTGRFPATLAHNALPRFQWINMQTSLYNQC